jgi:hypothetical protein
MQRAIYSLTALVLAFGLLSHVLRAESDREERALQQQAAEVCPKVWANPEVVKAKGLVEQTRQVCPEA